MSKLINGILAAEEAFASRVALVIRTHPRHLTAAVAAMLMTAGGGAFAVASLGPDAADLPIRQVLETVTPVSVESQSQALDGYSFTLFRTESTRASDTADALLGRLGVNDPAAAAFVRGNSEARAAMLSRVGRTISAEIGQDGRLHRLSARWVPDNAGGFRRITMQPDGASFAVRSEAETLDVNQRVAGGTIQSSLFAATDAAGIPDAVASQLADIFSGDVDFRQLRKGDRFAVQYESLEADGQAMRTGRVLAAEFENGGKVHQAMWFEPAGQKGGYYRFDGESLRRAYLASPVEFTRVSSGFAMRLHPILNSWRQHTGTDFAAPPGTPVRTVGDGTVDFAGWQNGYGNIVIINHRNRQQTAYAHLSRIDVKAGQSVSQGQRVGAVGSTGWATGPHLHFEFRIDGQYFDPQRMLAEQDGGTPIPASARAAFAKAMGAARTELAAASAVLQARAD